ncbi:MAG: type II secretion system protein [Sulfurospirillaceae bacterium]|nr:type II secretion system protein [Sulfurospirillaceae bacterium]
MKKAFTMLELIFVIIIVGILSAMIAPNFQRSSVKEAADQVISHIRYTQHLAMMNDRFDTSDSKWFKGRWQIHFYNNTGSDDQWAYTIFSDWKNTHQGNPDTGEIATNPLDPTKYLTGGTSGTGLIQYGDAEATKDLNLGHKYGITTVQFSGGCRSTVHYISFDSLGRPFNSFPVTLPYELPSAGYHKLLTTACDILLSDGDNNVTIAVEPETGYAHIL